MGWRKDSSMGAYIFDTEPMSPADLACRDEELNWLINEKQRSWRLLNGRLIGSADDSFPLGPLAAGGVYGGIAALPIPASIAGPAMSTTEAGILSAGNIAVYTPMLANSITAPQMWEVGVYGTYTVGATPGTIVFTLRLGNANTSPSLGASAAITQTNLTNAFWEVTGRFTVKTVGAPGTNSKANGTWGARVNTAVGGAFNSAEWGTGTTDASFDSTIALGTNGGGLWIGGTDAGATNHATYTIQQLLWGNWN
jgi:hypothetical protein